MKLLSHFDEDVVFILAFWVQYNLISESQILTLSPVLFLFGLK